MATTGSPTFTTTMWVIDRVHCHTTHRGTNAAPTLGTGLAE